MAWQLDSYQRGEIKKTQLGGWAWQLPGRGPNGEPASLPTKVIKFFKGAGASGRGKVEEDADDDGDEDEEAAPYALKEHKGSLKLVELKSQRAVALASLKKKGEPYTIYSTKNGWALAGGNPGDNAPEYIKEIFARAFPDDGDEEDTGIAASAKSKKLQKARPPVKAKKSEPDFATQPRELKSMEKPGPIQ